MQALLKIMRRLRSPGGCPWDREQTHDSLRPYLLEEAAEAVDAIAAGSIPAMVEELGDVLLQVAFHAVIGEEQGDFGYEDIEKAIVDKLVRRHPHVFADARAESAQEVLRNWQQLKAEEKGDAGDVDPADGVPRSLPALMRAMELSSRLGWSAPGEKGGIVFADLQSVGAIGEALLRLVQLAVERNVNPELALREALDARTGMVGASGE